MSTTIRFQCNSQVIIKYKWFDHIDNFLIQHYLYIYIIHAHTNMGFVMCIQSRTPSPTAMFNQGFVS